MANTPTKPTPDAAETEPVDTRPAIVQMFERIGLREGVTISQVRTVGSLPGDTLDGPHDVVQIHGCQDENGNIECVLALRDLGVGGPPRIVRWSQINSLIVH